MVGKINYIPQPRVEPAGTPNARNNIPAAGSSFAELLREKTARQQPVKLSAHAQKRLQQRNIVLGAAEMAKISRAMQRAETKGAKDSLLMYGDLALIANIKNKTVVTAVDGHSLKDYVFTNIDSAVIIK
ncbi:flagellar operon protein [Desulfohalotomaculum tongense]|uniref:TIGR02530 family flagellar biosynthesis protein n=1 Tax=Desulforadius tongensis TaxID=1216062 RepID=UPI001957F7F9|nr:flagellar operon protein [Desulforadius tongensis]